MVARFRQYQAFHAIIETGTVTGAAEALGISQPGISNLIAQLERQTKLNLFERKRGRLIATPEAAVLFFRSVAYSTWLPPSGDWGRHVVASYPQDNVLLRGWTLGEDKLARRAVVVDVGYKAGRVILIGFRSQHRGQTHATFKLLFNALYLPGLSQEEL